jgi:iron(III) transport system permease protein
MYVYFFLFVGAALRRIDRSTLEASADLGASSTATFWRVILPELRPAIVSASLLVFMISMASFTAPLLFAGTEQFLTLQIYNYKVNGSMALSATVSTLLTLICVAFLFALESSNRTGIRGASKGIQPPPNPVDAGPTRIGVIAASILFAAFVLLPVLTVVLVSFAREGSWTTQILPSQYTADNYVKLFGDASFALPIRNSLLLATISTSANLVFGVAAALTLVKTRAPFKWLIRLLVILPFAIPGTVVAINLIITFSRESALSFGEILLGTFWLMPLAYFIRNIPIIVRSTIASLETFDDRLIEASADLGARASRTFRSVVLPAILPGILAGTLLTFVASVGEFVSSILLYVYQNRPISVEIWSQLRIYDFGAAAAYSVLLMLIILAASVCVRILGGRGRERPRLPQPNGVPI